MDPTTVLFVDDDDFIRGAYVELLRDEGFSISGEVLLVLDEEMPRMKGREVLEHLDRQTDAARFRAVIISGSVDTECYGLPRRGIRVQAVVPKPFTADELLSTLHKLAA